MTFQATWTTLLEECDALEADATLMTPLSNKQFRITDVQEPRIVIELESGESRPLQREQFETLAERVAESTDGFSLDRLPPEAEAHAAVLSLHPHFELDDRTGEIHDRDEPVPSGLVSAPEPESDEREAPDLEIYADALLLVDALERHAVEDLESLETATLVNLYTLLSDVQRNANDLRQSVADVVLERVHHDQPIHGQFGSVQRTSREYRSLREEEEVLELLEIAGISREQVTSIDSTKVAEALEVTELTPSDVYEIDEREYVRKAEVDEDEKESRLQGLKDQLAGSEESEAKALREEIENLERRIEDLTEFSSGQEFLTE